MMMPQTSGGMKGSRTTSEVSKVDCCTVVDLRLKWDCQYDEYECATTEDVCGGC